MVTGVTKPGNTTKYIVFSFSVSVSFGMFPCNKAIKGIQLEPTYINTIEETLG